MNNESNNDPKPFAGATGSAALRAATRILAGSEHGAIRWHGQRADGQWCWQYREAGEIAAIIEEEMGKPLNPKLTDCANEGYTMTERDRINEAMRRDREEQAKRSSCAAPCSALASALDDGQEVKMFKLMRAGRGYCVTIHGDCYCESRSKETLEDAIKESCEKYAKWLKETE